MESSLCIVPYRWSFFHSGRWLFQRFFAWLADSSQSAASRIEEQRSSDETRRERNRRAEELLDRYGNSVLRMAYSYLHNMDDAEEVLQDTLIQFLKTDPVFENETHAKAWMLRVAGNLSKNRIRYNRIRQTDELQETLTCAERTDLSFVWEAVKMLPMKYREVIHLFYHEGYATAQIAQIVGEKESTVRSHLNRGRAKLKAVLGEAYDFDEQI